MNTAVATKPQITGQRYAKRKVEIFDFWCLSCDVRCGYLTPSMFEKKVDQFLNAPLRRSRWFHEKLQELREIVNGGR